MAGGGINDAPALAAANVGLAVGTGTAVAVESADIILVRSQLGGIVEARRLSKATKATIRENLLLAMAYNALAVPAAATPAAPHVGGRRHEASVLWRWPIRYGWIGEINECLRPCLRVIAVTAPFAPVVPVSAQRVAIAELTVSTGQLKWINSRIRRVGGVVGKAFCSLPSPRCHGGRSQTELGAREASVPPPQENRDRYDACAALGISPPPEKAADATELQPGTLAQSRRRFKICRSASNGRCFYPTPSIAARIEHRVAPRRAWSQRPSDPRTPFHEPTENATQSRSGSSPAEDNDPPTVQQHDRQRLGPVGIPGYRLIERWEVGTYGEVWLAQDQRTGIRVAIKFLSHGSSVDWQMIQAEVKQLALLHADPGIVQLLNVELDSKPPYFVMAYAEQGSLARRLDEGPLPAAEALEVFRQIAERRRLCSCQRRSPLRSQAGQHLAQGPQAHPDRGLWPVAPVERSGAGAGNVFLYGARAGGPGAADPRHALGRLWPGRDLLRHVDRPPTPRGRGDSRQGSPPSPMWALTPEGLPAMGEGRAPAEHVRGRHGPAAG